MKQLDIILPFRHSRWDDRELKYCLRSIEKYVSGVRKVIIVGDYPLSVNKGITWLPYDADDPSIVFKERNIYLKVRHALQGETTKDVLFFNDDHFVLRDYEASEFSNYFDEWPVKSDVYQTTYSNTKEVVGDVPFFDIHCPMVFNKDRFLQRMEMVDWDKKGGYCMKTLYAHGLPAEPHKDLKIRIQHPVKTLREMIKGREWFSMCDHARGLDMERLLNELYPIPSKYETTKKITAI